MTDIPNDFLQGKFNAGFGYSGNSRAFAYANADLLTGTLKVGPAVKTIGAWAFFSTKLTGLDLSKATSLVDIGENAFFRTDLAGTLVIPATVTTIGDSAFAYTRLTGTLKVGPAVKTIGAYAFFNTKLTGLDLSKATSLVEIGENAFFRTNLSGDYAFQGTKLTGFDI
eukprot:scaffold88258_cov44-Phaeocystis_antarctica.AAC.1